METGFTLPAETYLSATVPPVPASGQAAGPGHLADVLLCGVPWDEGSSFRRGPADAPEAIRRSSHGLEEYSFDACRDLRDLLLVDAGDLQLAPDAAPAQTSRLIQDRLQQRAGDLLAPSGLLVIMGGDHLVTVPAVAALAAVVASSDGQAAPPAVLIIDAHADLRQDFLGEAMSHACVTRRLQEMLGPARVQAAGVRSMSRQEARAADGCNLVWRHRSSPTAPFDLTSEAMKALAALPDDGPLYLSVDIDVCDPGYAPGVGAPEPGGVSARELIRAVQAIAAAAGGRLRGFDIVEVSPVHDAGDATAALAAKLIREVILWARR